MSSTSGGSSSQESMNDHPRPDDLGVASPPAGACSSRQRTLARQWRAVVRPTRSSERSTRGREVRGPSSYPRVAGDALRPATVLRQTGIAVVREARGTLGPGGPPEQAPRRRRDRSAVDAALPCAGLLKCQLTVLSIGPPWGVASSGIHKLNIPRRPVLREIRASVSIRRSAPNGHVNAVHVWFRASLYRVPGLRREGGDEGVGQLRLSLVVGEDRVRHG